MKTIKTPRKTMDQILQDLQEKYAVAQPENSIDGAFEESARGIHIMPEELKRLFYTAQARPKRIGSIHGIWLTTENGKLHPQILPNLVSWLEAAKNNLFDVILWTNLDQIDPLEIERLRTQNILVKDHNECKDNRLYPIFMFFLELGLKGDKSAFALASDILRMAILDMIDDNEIFIYADANDIEFVELQNYLTQIHRFILHNSFSFSFGINPLFAKIDQAKIFEFRNDVLIAHKFANPEFFKNYLDAYYNHVGSRYSLYCKPCTDKQAQDFATTITCSTSGCFFEVVLGAELPVVRAKFGNHKEFTGLIDVLAYLPHIRMPEHSNTWLPIGDAKEEKAMLKKMEDAETTYCGFRKGFLLGN